MAFVKRITLAVMILAAAAPIAMAGPNAGGVLVVHATTMVYTVDVASYMGQSGVACGQDQPLKPNDNVCPPYDPVDGANPCIPTAANPTLGIPPEGQSYVWYVLAAFAEGSCPRLTGVAFRLDYDKTKVAISHWGTSSDNFEVQFNSDLDDAAFPAPGSGVGIGFATETKTSLLQEVYWFDSYSYAGATDAVIQLRVKSETDNGFIDDNTPKERDAFHGLGRLGLGGTVGENPIPIPSPTEERSWGRIKAGYGAK